SPSQVVQALRTEHGSASAGTVNRGSGELQVRVKGEFNSLNDISQTIIRLPAGGQVKISDIAVIKDTFEKQTSYTIVNNEPSLILSVQKQSDANTVKVSDEVLKAVSNMEDS